MADRIDDLIIDAGTSDAETIAARTAIRYGSAPATLGAALAIVAARTIYVDAYGAVGDGTTNDATALAAAFAAAGTGDTIVFTPGKTYKCNSALTNSDNGLTIIGYGATLNTSALNGTALTLTGQRVTVQGLTFIGESTSGSVEAPAGKESRAIQSNGAYLRVQDCRFEGYFQGGIRANGARAIIRGNTLISVRNYEVDHYGAIHVGGVSHAIISDNHISDALDAGISIFRSNHCVISNNTIVCTATGGGGGSMGIYANAEIVGCTISGNTITEAANEGIMLGNGLANSESYGNAITGNTIIDSHLTGITVRAAFGTSGNVSTNRNCAVMGNTISIITRSGAVPCDYGIFIDSASTYDTVTDITVSGNSISATKDGASYRLVRGIVGDGVGVARLTYTGNSVDGAAVGIYMSGTYVLLTGNMIRNCSTSINCVASAYGLAVGNTTVSSATDSILYSIANTGPVATNNYLDKKATSAPATWRHNAIVDFAMTDTVTLVAGEANVVSAAFSTTAGSAIISLERVTVGGTPGALYVSAINQSENRVIIKSTSATDTSTITWRLIR